MASMRASSGAVVRQYSPVAPFTTSLGEAFVAQKLDNRAEAVFIQFAIREAGNQDCGVDTLYDHEIRQGL